MEPFSGREMWRPANVNALEELMHRTLICSSSARWRHVWKKGRVCAWIPNTLQVPRKLRACFLLHRGKSHQSGKKLSVLIQLSGEDVGENHQRTSCCAGALTRHLLSPTQREGEHVHCADGKAEDQGTEISMLHSTKEFELRVFSPKILLL